MNQVDSFVWKGHAVELTPPVARYVEQIGRVGYFAKGFIYFVVGYLAFKLAIGADGQATGAAGAIRAISSEPFGRLVLMLLAAGLGCYALWRAVQVIWNTENRPANLKGYAIRAGNACSGLTYAALAGFAACIAIGIISPRFGIDGVGDASTDWIIDSTVGRCLMAAGGLIFIGVAVDFFIKVARGKFMRKYDLSNMSETVRLAALWAGRIGLSTRGIAFMIIGGLLIMTAYRGTAHGDIHTTEDALVWIASQTYGAILIGVMGVGFMLYCVHSSIRAVHRQFSVAVSA